MGRFREASVAQLITIEARLRIVAFTVLLAQLKLEAGVNGAVRRMIARFSTGSPRLSGMGRQGPIWQ